MNRFSIIRVIIAILFVSCSEGIVEIKKEQPSDIHFSTLLSKASAINSTSSLAQKGGFSVWAYSHSGSWDPIVTKTPLLDNITVTSTDGVTWGYASPVPWPESENVSFFAYGPAGSATINNEIQDATGAPVIQFTVNDNPTLQTDLLIAQSIPDQNGANYGFNAPVMIRFDHALSQIKFSALAFDHDDKEVKVTRIELTNLYYKAETSLHRPVDWSWDLDTSAGVKNYALTTSNGLLNTALTTEPQMLNTASGMLFLLPQTIDRQILCPELKVTLTIDGATVDYILPVFATTKWEAGKSYNYQLVVLKDELQVVVFADDLQLNDWNISIMIQPVPLSKNSTLDMLRIHAALSSLGHINADGTGDLDVSKCRYFALYLRNEVLDDITIDMTEYNELFTAGEYMMFDAKKMVTKWGKNEAGTSHKLSITNYADHWTLGEAAQPLGADVDGTTYATTSTEKNPAEPRDYIRNKGSIILVRKADEPQTPETP